MSYWHGDRDRISQVINNIVTNAIKYSLPKAEIRILQEKMRIIIKLW